MSPPIQENLVTVVAEMTGLTSMLAPGTVRRSLRDVGIDPYNVTARDMMRALPQMQARLCAFQAESEVRDPVQVQQPDSRNTLVALVEQRFELSAACVGI